MEKNNFLFLCEGYRQENYHDTLGNYKDEIVFYQDIDKLLHHCIEKPPNAVFVDLKTSMRNTSNSLLNTLYRLNMNWPVLRCNMGGDGSASVMSIKGEDNGESLSEVIKNIMNNDPDWSISKINRIFMRADVTCRIQMHKVGEKKWGLGNITSLSSGGSYVISYDPPDIGETIRLKIMDISSTPIDCKGEVKWVRRWDEGTQLPGVGLTFDRRSFTSPHKKALVEFLFNSLTKRL
ncbi:MAG: PilZ domain-containing protein [Nitrospinae bacterium]|nr:PilZ domain-containing protein [Nitrospinota bacterium]